MNNSLYLDDSCDEQSKNQGQPASRHRTGLVLLSRKYGVSLAFVSRYVMERDPGARLSSSLLLTSSLHRLDELSPQT